MSENLSPSLNNPPAKPPRDLSVLGWAAIAVGMIAATYVGSSSWERVRTKPPERSIEVTGSAKRRITSDLAQWSAVISTQNKDRTIAYRELHANMDKAIAFLKTEGFTDKDIRVGSAAFNELNEQEVTGTGAERVEKQVFVGYQTTESVSVTSNNVVLIEKASREITQLLEQGITVTSEPPAYFYTKLGELKIEMLAEASKDARTRAENMIRSAGGAEISRLRTADMGIININPANSTSTSEDGNNDTTSMDKDIRTIVHASYELK